MPISQAALRIAPWCLLLAISARALFAQPSAMPSLEARFAGKGLPDFTVEYECHRRDSLANVTEQEMRAHAERFYNRLSLANRLRVDRSRFPERIANVMRGARAFVGRELAIITISQRGGKLLFYRKEPAIHSDCVILYDGKRTLSTWRGMNVQIYPGLDCVVLRDFVFPGSGVAGIPWILDLRAGGKPGRLMGRIAEADGGSDGGLPAYSSGTVDIAEAEGVTVAAHTRSGFDGAYNPGHEIWYSGYRRVAPNLMIPGRIRYVASYSPDFMMPRSEHTIDYRLRSVSARALPESAFHIEGQLRGRTVVQDNTGKKPTTVTYTRGKSLDEQFADRAKQDAASAKLAQSHGRTRSATMVLGGMAVAALLILWLRMALARRGGGAATGGN